MPNTNGAMHGLAPSSSGAAGTPASAAPRVRIAANKNRVDDRDPSLGFTIDTAGLPYFEVLLATDRRYFDPQNAAGRTGANFYASRQDSGLIRATGQHSVYLAPAGVLRSFARSQPHPDAIYYTVVAYARQDGSGPVFAMPPEALKSGAPSVVMAADFKGHTLSRVLGVPVEKLRYVGATSLESFVSDDTGEDIEADADPGDAEDGYAAEAAAQALAGYPGAAPYEEPANPWRPRATGAAYEEPVNPWRPRAKGVSYEEPANPWRPRASGASYQEPANPWRPQVSGRAYGSALDEEEERYGDGYGDGLDDDGLDDDQMADYTAQAAAYEARPGAAQLAYSDGYDDEDDEDLSAPPAPRRGYAAEAQDDQAAYRDGWDEDQSVPSSAQGVYADGFGDGFGEAHPPYHSDEDGGWAQSASVAYPAGAGEPAQLEDDSDDDGLEDNDYDPVGSEFSAIQSLDAGAYGGGYRGAYGDEADTWGMDSSSAPAAAAPAPPAQPLTIDVKLALIEQVAPFESGSDGYAAANPDGEFSGRIPNHPAQGRYHIGLSYGIVQFTQDSGNLGRLLEMMRDRDPQTFARIFGPSANQLIAVTNAPGPESRQVPGGRSARVQPVDGVDLWEQPWLGRFVQAGGVRSFQAAQNELAAGLFLDPMLQFAGWLGLNTDRALALVFDRAVQMGMNGAKLWIAGACCPIQTAAQRQQALAALGCPDLLSFQRTTPGLVQDGLPGPNSDAALTAALRRLGAASPIPIPTRDQMVDTMVRRAASERFARRVAELRQSRAFRDVEYQIP